MKFVFLKKLLLHLLYTITCPLQGPRHTRRFATCTPTQLTSLFVYIFTLTSVNNTIFIITAIVMIINVYHSITKLVITFILPIDILTT